MNVFILILYTYGLFSASHGSIVIDLDKDSPSGKKVVELEPLNTRLEAQNLYEYLDPSVDPCDNFYLFSCGKWIRTQKKIYGDNDNSSIRDQHTNFNKFRDGKYDKISEVARVLQKRRKECLKTIELDKNECLQVIDDFATYAISTLFVTQNRKKSEKRYDFVFIEDMIKRIREEFRLLIDEKKHIFDEETRNNFLFKLGRIEYKKDFGESDIFNIEIMNDCYAKKGIHYFFPLSDLVNEIKHDKSLSDKNKDDLKSCRGKIFQVNSVMSEYVYRNAWYNIYDNYFSINSDAFNKPSFSIRFPNSLNYGFLGFKIAHEIMHAFDSNNYNRTLEGNNKNKFNVTQKSVKHFEEKSKCFIEQYGMQIESITDKYINGSLVLNESIADNGGLKLAYKAYMKWLQSNGGKDIEVPGFEKFTNEQLFFIGAGRSNCQHTGRYTTENQINSDTHPPGEIRTNVALSNYKPFSAAFNCPINSNMNPEDKCELWKI
uniref:Peptidase_M13 domain-containing protein n=1 Tax=Strongyloides papillosus TaxID=174720 RepID=A0A0N5B503_STREA